MKRHWHQRKPNSSGQPKKSPPVRDRRIILINDAPLRKRAASEFKRAIAKLDEARAESLRFEQEDQPAFGSWMASTFGAVMTELRENSILIAERMRLIQEVEIEMMMGTYRNVRQAYAAVMKRRENPQQEEENPERNDSRGNFNRDDRGEEDDDWDDVDFDDDDDNGSDIPPKERRAIFEDFLRSVAGFDPRDMERSEYEKAFAAFEKSVFGKKSESKSHGDGEEQPRKADETELRIKEVYRTLVRRLHPDLKADNDVKVSAIWHEVQEAYAAKNLDRLETLLALTEMQNGKGDRQTSLSQMKQAVRELGRSLRAIQRSIQDAKKHPAWGFSKGGNRAPLEKRIRKEMQQSLADQKWHLSDIQRTLADWSRPWTPPVKKKPKAKAKKPEPKSKKPTASQPDLFG